MQIANAKPKEKIYKLRDGSGLFFRVYPNNWRQWIFIFSWNKKQKSMGLGGYPTVSLAEAREQASKARAIVRNGLNPIIVRKNLFKENLRKPTLNEICQQTWEAKKKSLVNDGANSRWLSPLENHLLPKIGEMFIEDIKSDHIETALKPIWHNKQETARRCIYRLRMIMEYAEARNLDVHIDQVEKAKRLLGDQDDVPTKRSAMDWREVPAFYQSLNDTLISNQALKLLILTGLRSDPIRHANVSWINSNIMTVPAKHMKGAKLKKEAFRVPLSTEALKLIDKCYINSNGILFSGERGDYLSNNAMLSYMNKRGYKNKASPHGFRSSLRTWLDEYADAEYEIKETVISHKFGSKVSQSYARSDHFEKRALLHERWAKFLTGKESATVTPIRVLET